MPHLLLIVFTLGAGLSFWQPGVAHTGTTGAPARVVLLPGDRLVRGTVQDVKSRQIQVNSDELHGSIGGPLDRDAGALYETEHLSPA